MGGDRFTCFTSTKLRALLVEKALRSDANVQGAAETGGAHFTCVAAVVRVQKKSTNTDP
jgi:hypothetical protein